MPIGIEGQYLFQFDVADKKDFIVTEDLIKFEVIEEAGNILPTFTLIFLSTDSKLLRILHEGNSLNVSFGKDRKNLIKIKLNITKHRSRKKGDSKREYYLTGLLFNLKFNNKPNLLISDKMSGVEVILNTAKKHFGKIDTNIKTSNDSQYWIQPNISDKMFINNLWLHSYVPNSFLGVGISMDGTFILRDILKMIKDYQSKNIDMEKYKYRFLGTPKNKNDMIYHGDYTLDTEYGFINYWHGYKKNKVIYDLDEGTLQTISEEIRPMISLTSTLIRNIEIEKRYSDVGYQNENVHKNYWKAYLRNVSSLAIFSSTKLEFSFDTAYVDIKILDLIMFQEPELDQKQLSGDQLSGQYLVSKVSRTLSGGTMVTNVLACREALNRPKGSVQ